MQGPDAVGPRERAKLMAEPPPPPSPMRAEEVMSDLVPDSGRAAPTGPLARLAYALGSIGLLAATAADATAVAGRHSGFQLLGSIEIVQACVVLLASSGMLIATIVGAHACVHIVTERVSKATATRLGRIADLVSAGLFAILAIGSAWVLADLWTGFERTELLQIPLRWLRLLWVGAAVAITVQFLRNAYRRRP